MIILNGQKLSEEFAEFSDNARAVLYGNARAVLYNNASATLSDNASATLYDNARAVGRDFSVIFLKSEKASANGKNIIRVKYPDNIVEWADLKGIPIINGRINLWKAVDKNGNDFRTGLTSYLGDATAPDWDHLYKDECGSALHLSDSPSGARLFVSSSDRDSYRLIMVSAKIEDCIPFGGYPEYPMDYEEVI